jgi:ankyrin repeat protein
VKDDSGTQIQYQCLLIPHSLIPLPIGLSTMHIAAQNDKVDVMHYLVAKGVDVSVRDNQGSSCITLD